MGQVYTELSTGIEELDKLINYLLPGDNVIWQVDNFNQFRIFLDRFCENLTSRNIKINYFKFCQDINFLDSNKNIKIYNIDPEVGFEDFLTNIVDIIEENGKGEFYIFDPLSELSADWNTDKMLSNFFSIVCPFLYQYETIAYFALLRNYHVPIAKKTIFNIAQVVIDVYEKNNELFIKPLKVDKRYSSNLNKIFRWTNKKFIPVTNSAIISSIVSENTNSSLNFVLPKLDIWNQTFLEAYEIIEDEKKGWVDLNRKNLIFEKIVKMCITKDQKMLGLINKYFTLEDLLLISKRMVGTGFIGGKSLGMLLSRAILKKNNNKFSSLLEEHDSFFICSDVFYSYLIENGCWWIRRNWKKKKLYLDGIQEIYDRILDGNFSDDIIGTLYDILEYYGDFPFIVRSSSLLEDAYGNSFSGKYESVFCANQSGPKSKLDEFIRAIKIVYASTMNKDAIVYRIKFDLIEKEEEMALLIQRVSGIQYGKYFFPQIAGVGFSFNPYIWNKSIDPSSGVIRLVFGLGTRAVNRQDDDYTRIISLSNPLLRPETNYDEISRYSQHKLDLIDLESNSLSSIIIENISNYIGEFEKKLFFTYNEEMDRMAKQYHLTDYFPFTLSFNNLITKTNFINDMVEILKILEKSYENPVDIEFTLNFIDNDTYKINLLQCRPFQVRKKEFSLKEYKDVPKEKILFRVSGPIIGTNTFTELNRIIFVSPAKYVELNESKKYSCARIIGNLNYQSGKQNRKLLLIGPGRWGTSIPSLGIPVIFSEINNASGLCEIVQLHKGLVPDVSLGTHFFNDIVEMDMIYIAIYPEKENNFLNNELLENLDNKLNTIMPEYKDWENVIKLIDSDDEYKIILQMNPIEQTAILYIE